MGFRSIETRAGVTLTAMSLALLLALRRGGAFRGGSTAAAFSRNFCRGGSRHATGVSASASGEAVRGRSAGPEGTELPDIMHRTLSAEELKAEVIVVGDIHGCHGEMVSLLERCGYRLGNREDKERFSVILAGDLVNKGPANAEVVRTARKEGFLAVRGNHDNFALAAATGVGRYSKSVASKDGEGGAKPPPWVEQLSSGDIEWMSALPYTLSLPSMGCIVVHAGLVPGMPLDSQDAEAMCCMRNVVELEDGRGYEPHILPTEGVAWAKAWKGPEHVIFGHDAKRGFQKEPFATGLDTGCVYGRSLTAIVLPGRKIVCVPAEKMWSDPGGGGGKKQGE
ncbi:unnamed protein product [Scytosiphon promiscuus]